MASPYLRYDKLLTLATDGGYEITTALSNLSAVFLLSACVYLREKWLWQNPIAPIDSTTYNNIIQMIEQTEFELMNNMAIGSVVPYLGVVTFDNLLPMDGTTYAQADYPELSAILPTSLKTGGNFTLPDMSDFFIIGSDADANIANMIGSNTHNLDISEIPSHTHSYSMTTAIPTAAGLEPTFADVTTQVPSNTGSAGGNQPHNNIPASVKMKYYIVAR